MRISLHCAVYCTTVILPGFSSVLPRTEEYVEGLESNSRKRLKRGLDRAKYRSLYDQILCSAYPQMKEHCQDYYSGRGPDIQEQLSDLQIEMIDKSLKAWVKMLVRSIN